MSDDEVLARTEQQLEAAYGDRFDEWAVDWPETARVAAPAGEPKEGPVQSKS